MLDPIEPTWLLEVRKKCEERAKGGNSTATQRARDFERWAKGVEAQPKRSYQEGPKPALVTKTKDVEDHEAFSNIASLAPDYIKRRLRAV